MIGVVKARPFGGEHGRLNAELVVHTVVFVAPVCLVRFLQVFCTVWKEARFWRDCFFAVSVVRCGSDCASLSLRVWCEALVGICMEFVVLTM